MAASTQLTYDRAEGWKRHGRKEIPIAMNLMNGAEWATGAWHGVLETRLGERWWFCPHLHLDEESAQMCAREMWFKHHG